MIRTLNLDGMFIPIKLPEIKYNLFNFAGGEWHIKLNNRIDYSMIEEVIITHRLKNMDDLMQVFIVKNALECKGVKEISLFIPYLPYARQDRNEIDGEAFTLKVFADLINSQNFNSVTILDPHSYVGPALINNTKIVKNHVFIEMMLKDLNVKNKLHLISPDAGANKKTNELYSKYHKYFKSLIKCDKTRNIKTGELSGFEVFTDDLNGEPCLIVDDICDGGGTFIGLANELKDKNAGDIYLFVSHGIFSKGFNELKKYFKGIYTTNSVKDIDSDFVTQYKL